MIEGSRARFKGLAYLKLRANQQGVTEVRVRENGCLHDNYDR